ncbi:MAG TPA: hypothetical protein VKY44_07940 [Flavobacterium sp.]|nr:hypothetical protein [Flavobacterium sp.]
MISFYKSFILISLVGILSSNITIQKEKIHKIEYRQHSGGKGGGFTYLEINKDSIYFLQGATRQKTDTIIKKTPLILWQKLSKVSIKEFETIESGMRTAPADGTDTTISINTNIKNYSFVNGKYNNSDKISDFVKVVENEISNIRTEIYQSKQNQ